VTEEPAVTSWKQWKLPQLNLGTLVSVLVAVGFITWQGFMIRGQIDDNSQAVGDMAIAVEELAGAVSLANELDTRTNILFDEIGSLRDQYQDQADVWIEISTLSERIDVARNDSDSLRGDVESTWHQQNELRMEMVESVAEFDLARTTLADLGWKVDDLERRVSEAFGAEMADTGDDYSWQITDLVRQVAELQGRVNASGDTGWEIDEVNRRTDELFDNTDEMWDMLWRMDDLLTRLWSALETRNWASDYLHD
jgi:chromosome segregation ATPase